MNWIRFGRTARAIRLRSRLRQADLADRARVSRSAVSLLERGHAARLRLSTVDRILNALGASFTARVAWNGTEVDRLLDADHAGLTAAVKARLERWAWIVRAEVSFNHYGDRGRIDLLAWHPATRVLLIVEVKTDLVDVQDLLGTMDVRVRVAPRLAAGFGWEIRTVVPAIVFLEDRTTRRRLTDHAILFDRFALVGRSALTWTRDPATTQPAPTGVLWWHSLPNARVMRIGGQRVRIRASRQIR